MTTVETGVTRLLLSAREAAQSLNTSERTLYSISEPRGPLKCVRMNSSTVKYRPADLEAYLDQLQANPIQPKSRPNPIVRKPRRGGARKRKEG